MCQHRMTSVDSHGSCLSLLHRHPRQWSLVTNILQLVLISSRISGSTSLRRVHGHSSLSYLHFQYSRPYASFGRRAQQHAAAANGNSADPDNIRVRQRDGENSGVLDDSETVRADILRSRRQVEQVQRLQDAGLTASQISAYSGIQLVDLNRPFVPEPKSTPSHTFVPRDRDVVFKWHDAFLVVTGSEKHGSYVYVDEYTCIGCTNCATTAPNTFFMEDDFGRARVYQQWVDNKNIVKTAVETCPVDCIHYVDYDELQRLEIERAGLRIEHKARLVGSDGLLSGQTGMQDISANRGYRCPNCPTRGCFNCPMYSVGDNPEYVRKRNVIEAKRKAQKQKAKEKKRLEL